MNISSIEEKASLLTNRLRDCVQSFMKKVPIKVAENAWYDINMRNLRLRRDDAYKRAVLSHEQDHWRFYKARRNEYCQKMRETKKKDVDNFKIIDQWKER